MGSTSDGLAVPLPGEALASGNTIVGPPGTSLVGVIEQPVPSLEPGVYESMTLTSVDGNDDPEAVTIDVHFVEVAEDGRIVVRPESAEALVALRDMVLRMGEGRIGGPDEFRNRFNASDAYPTVPRVPDPQAPPPVDSPPGTTAPFFLPSVLEDFSVFGRVLVQVARVREVTEERFVVVSDLVPVEGLQVCLFEDDPGGPLFRDLDPFDDPDDIVACDVTSEEGRFRIVGDLRRDLEGSDPEFYVAARTHTGDFPGGFKVVPEPWFDFEEAPDSLADWLTFPFSALAPGGGGDDAYVFRLNDGGTRSFRSLAEMEARPTTSGWNVGDRAFELFDSTRSVTIDEGVATSRTDGLASIMTIFREARLAQVYWMDGGGPVRTTFDGESNRVRIAWPAPESERFSDDSSMIPFDPYPTDPSEVLQLLLLTQARALDPRFGLAATRALMTDPTNLRGLGDITTPPNFAEELALEVLYDAIELAGKDDYIIIQKANLFVEESDVVRHEFGHFG